MTEESAVPNWVTLGTDERVEWVGRPSPYLVKYWLAVAVGVLLVGALVWVLVPAEWRWLSWPVFAAALAVGGYAVVAYRSVVYVITSRKVYRKRGILRRDVTTVRLDRIQNTSFTQTMLQKLTACGDMTVETAGSHEAELTFRCVREPASVNGLLSDRLFGADWDDPRRESVGT
ncbi:PH domain-containing protein [Halomarina rubra]|uniref:PH domain-containing protein n=1 Tax=Halomarina rubra TaxID=2071873 RepID=A0ABD6AYX6_9EURY|nr:PH domain-containing protein [Halomarina rubra]